MEMKNINIVEWMVVNVEGKRVQIYAVKADSERFGKQCVMYEGTYEGCIDYLKREGVDYIGELIEKDPEVQVANTMNRVIYRDAEKMILRGRDGYDHEILFSEMKPIAPLTWQIPRSWVRIYKTSKIKFWRAKTW